MASRSAGKPPENFSNKTTRIERFAQMSKQEQLIQQKKKEIEAKFLLQRKKSGDDPSKLVDSTPGVEANVPVAEVCLSVGTEDSGFKSKPGKKLWRGTFDPKWRKDSKNPPVPPTANLGKPNAAGINVFVNDGSFLEQFKKNKIQPKDEEEEDGYNGPQGGLDREDEREDGHDAQDDDWGIWDSAIQPPLPNHPHNPPNWSDKPSEQQPSNSERLGTNIWFQNTKDEPLIGPQYRPEEPQQQQPPLPMMPMNIPPPNMINQPPPNIYNSGPPPPMFITQPPHAQANIYPAASTFQTLAFVTGPAFTNTAFPPPPPPPPQSQGPQTQTIVVATQAIPAVVSTSSLQPTFVNVMPAINQVPPPLPSHPPPPLQLQVRPPLPPPNMVRPPMPPQHVQQPQHHHGPQHVGHHMVGLNSAAEQLAKMVAEGGDEIEEMARHKNRDDPAMWFLYDVRSPMYMEYRGFVHKLREEERIKRHMNNANKRNWNDADDGYKGDNESDRNEKNRSSERSKKRRSRWGPQESSVPPPTVAGVEDMVPLPLVKTALGGPTLSKVTRTDPNVISYAMKVFGSANISDEQWVQAEDHYKLSLTYQDMLRKRAELDRLARCGQNKYEYDSDEELDGGTWEHKLRTKEMELTQMYAEELTSQAEGKHHIGDFLPPEELEKFLEKFRAIREDRDPDLSDYKDNRITEENIGFQMLQKLGWSEGQGLGVEGQGIVAPVNKAIQRADNHGLGVEKPDDVARGDDEYDAYRKRMMLSYRFRPNPLNNPRRPYY